MIIREARNRRRESRPRGIMFIMIIASCELPFRVTVINEPYMYNNKIIIDQNHRKNMIVKIMLLVKRTETN